ncbi:TlyA family RNA methyltransferase [Clostridium sp. Cult3]|uniref:TlyA family RNA methyltransferase n=1 Tax=Clostridium sp. Cult3 TaxID=2079004 RepID=UPI001F1B7D5C|nr:TlyA family RNA methyltransferase [Clostridium sp. Cult3]MCF6460102.1 TlyA family rRNA (cytidine-2'-O)-methyltransferase [Clostridium sp. Cult3]
MEKKRADIILFEKGLVESREKAKRVIMEGTVFIGDMRIDKPGEKVSIDDPIEIKKNPLTYVSRGGLKLEKAIKYFNLNLEDKITMDIGASTGGFTDCMLQYGARKVYAIDVGYGQLDWKLRKDPRVVVKERTNIRHVTKEDIDEIFDLISIDVSFISLRLVLPVAKELLADDGHIVALIKPQFEAGRDKVGKKGIVRDRNIHIEVIKAIADFSNSIQLNIVDLDYSPIAGATGNIEFLAYISKNMDESSIDDEYILKVVSEAHESL